MNDGRALRRGRLSAAARRNCFFLAVDFDKGELVRRMLRRFSRRAGDSMSPPHLNGRGPDEADTSGSSSRTPFLLRWPAGLARTF